MTYVQVSEDTHNLGETMRLKHVEELESLHFEAVGSVNEQEHEISDLGNVDSGREIVGNLDESGTSRLGCNDGDGTLDFLKIAHGVVLNEGADERRLTDARGTVNSDNNGRRLFNTSIDHGGVVLLHLLVHGIVLLTRMSSGRVESEGLWKVASRSEKKGKQIKRQ